MKKKRISIINSIIIVVLMYLLSAFYDNKKINNETKYIPPKFGDLSSGKYFFARDVNYNNDSGTLKSRTVQNAIDELYAALSSDCFVGYTKGTTTSTQYICNKSTSDSTIMTLFDASDVLYNNSHSGLTATNLSTAIYETSQRFNYCIDGYHKDNELSDSYECIVNTLPSTLTIANNNISLTYGGGNDENEYAYNGDGTVSCSSSNASKVTCSVNSTTHKIIITPVEATTSEVTLTISAAATANYYAPESLAITVNVSKYTPTLAISATTGSVNYGSTNSFTATPTTISGCVGT